MWLKKAPINLFSLTLLIAALYFTIFATNVYAIGALSFLLGCFLKHHWKNKAALKLVGLVGSFFLIYFLFLQHRATFIKLCFPKELNDVEIESIRRSLRQKGKCKIEIDIPDKDSYEFHY